MPKVVPFKSTICSIREPPPYQRSPKTELRRVFVRDFVDIHDVFTCATCDWRPLTIFNRSFSIFWKRQNPPKRGRSPCPTHATVTKGNSEHITPSPCSLIEHQPQRKWLADHTIPITPPPGVHCQRVFTLPPGVNPIAVDKYIYLSIYHELPKPVEMKRTDLWLQGWIELLYLLTHLLIYLLTHFMEMSASWEANRFCS